MVIDTVVCLTLAKWETVSGQFGGYLSLPCLAKSFACVSFVAISTLECLFLLCIAACIPPSRCCRKFFICALVLQSHALFLARQWQPFYRLEINMKDGSFVWCGGMEYETCV